MSKAKFKTGDIVRFASGGPLMTVILPEPLEAMIIEDPVKVGYFSEGKFKSVWLPSSTLSEGAAPVTDAPPESPDALPHI